MKGLRIVHGKIEIDWSDEARIFHPLSEEDILVSGEIARLFAHGWYHIRRKHFVIQFLWVFIICLFLDCTHLLKVAVDSPRSS
jgi:hypothetical protein